MTWVDVVPLDEMSRLGRRAHFSVRVVATAEMETLMNPPTAEKLFFVEPGTAEEICKVLEETIFKYFPPQIENPYLPRATLMTEKQILSFKPGSRLE